MSVNEQISKYIGNAVKQAEIWGEIFTNVKATPYLAQGDGVTDDTLAIQAAIDDTVASGGKAIFFPPGTYLVTSLDDKDEVVFFGNNASFSGISYVINQIGASYKAANSSTTVSGSVLRIAEILTESINDDSAYTHGLFRFTHKTGTVRSTVIFTVIKTWAKIPQIVILNCSPYMAIGSLFSLRAVYKDGVGSAGVKMFIEVNFFSGAAAGECELLMIDGNDSWNLITPVAGSVPDGYTSVTSVTNVVSTSNFFVESGGAVINSLLSTANNFDIYSGGDLESRLDIKMGANRRLYLSGSEIFVRAGSGSPEGVVTAEVGSLFTRADGGAGTTLYIKESGSGNTGWVAK